MSHTLAREIRAGTVTTSALSADQADLDPGGGSVLRYDCAAAHVLSGIAAGTAGRTLLVLNIGTAALRLSEEDDASAAANRLAFGATLVPGEGIELWYDAAATRWRRSAQRAAGLGVAWAAARGALMP